MSSISGLYHRKLQSTIANDSLNLTNTNYDDVPEWYSTLAFVAQLLAYIAVLVVLAVVLLLIVKLVGCFEEDTNTEDLGATETNPLRQGKTVSVIYNYGTISDKDIGKENGSSSSSSSSSSGDNYSSRSSSSEELYDGKLCVICYDEQRDCFFVPCGHCATCYVCAQRIFYGESKTCPVCRRFIGKVRRLFAA